MATKSTKRAPAKRSTSRSTTTARRQQQTPETTKPVFKAGTLVTLIVFVAIVLFTVLWNRQKETKAAETTPTVGVTSVFDAAEGNPTSIEIKPSAGETVQIKRDESKAWVVEQPLKLEADQGTAEAAASQLASLKVTTEVTGDPSIFGLDKPEYVITVTFDSGKSHTLEVGDVTPTNSGYYVRLDNGKMMIVEPSGIDALSNLVFFPPYLNTPTPTALPPTPTTVPPTETPVPASATPTP